MKKCDDYLTSRWPQWGTMCSSPAYWLHVLVNRRWESREKLQPSTICSGRKWVYKRQEEKMWKQKEETLKKIVKEVIPVMKQFIAVVTHLASQACSCHISLISLFLLLSYLRLCWRLMLSKSPLCCRFQIWEFAERSLFLHCPSHSVCLAISFSLSLYSCLSVEADRCTCLILNPSDS